MLSAVDEISQKIISEAFKSRKQICLPSLNPKVQGFYYIWLYIAIDPPTTSIWVLYLLNETQFTVGGREGREKYNTGSIFLLLQSLRHPRGNRPDVSPLELWFDLKPLLEENLFDDPEWLAYTSLGTTPPQLTSQSFLTS